MLHGNIAVNYHIIGEWVAQNAGPRMDAGIYRCHVWYTDLQGYRHERRFFLRHNYDDGALVLGASVMLEFNKCKDWTEHSEATEWLNFCEMHALDPVASLGYHITLKKTP